MAAQGVKDLVWFLLSSFLPSVVGASTQQPTGAWWQGVKDLGRRDVLRAALEVSPSLSLSHTHTPARTKAASLFLSFSLSLSFAFFHQPITSCPSLSLSRSLSP